MRLVVHKSLFALLAVTACAAASRRRVTPPTTPPLPGERFSY